MRYANLFFHDSLQNPHNALQCVETHRIICDDQLEGDEMHWAIEEHDVAQVHDLLAQGYNSNKTIRQSGCEQYPLLHFAANYGSQAIIDLLLQYGADPNITTEKGYTVLHLAARDGNIELANLLLQYRADINVQDYWGDTPLHWAFEANHIEFCENLIAQGADQAISNSKNERPMDRLPLTVGSNARR
jgi:ankyrin repeat protein